MHSYIAGVQRALLEKIAKIEEPGLVAGATMLPVPFSGPIAAAVLADEGQRGEAFWKTLGGETLGGLGGSLAGGLLGAIPSVAMRNPLPAIIGAGLGGLIGTPLGAYYGAKWVD